MELIKNIFISSRELIITYILTYLLAFLFFLPYSIIDNNIDNYLSNIYPYIMLVLYIITIIYLLKKNSNLKNKHSKIKYFPYILLGISLSCFLNMLIFKSTPPTNIIIPSPLLIITSSIIGPVYEEVIFRYLIYNRLAKNYSTLSSILITSLLFALIHLNPIKIIYALILGLVLNISYYKSKIIVSPILIHVAANLISIFLIEYNTYILLLSIIGLLLSIKTFNLTTELFKS